MKSPTAEYSGFVEHPRYGRGPRFTGLDVTDSLDGQVHCHWHSPVGVRVPRTAVVADVARQRPATLHVTHYFDATRVCRTCGRPFLFFADEQKYWYEDLGFPLEADCLECAPCRKDEQRLRLIRQKYDLLFPKTARTEGETLELVECGVLLLESSVFSAKIVPKLRGLLNALSVDAEGPFYQRAQVLMSRIDRLLLCAIGVILSSALVFGQTIGPVVLSEALRAHVKNDRFQIVTSIRGLPLGVRDALQTLFGSQAVDIAIAEPGAQFQVTDVVVNPKLPIRRMVSAGCSADHCLVYYERGGIAHTWQVALFHWTPAATRFEAGGIAPGGLATIDDVRNAVLSGAIKGPTKVW